MTETEKTLRETFRKMDAERYTQIRNAYYKAIEGLKITKLLNGYRGQARGDIAALVDAVFAAGEFVIAKGADIEELDINPLMVLPEGQGVVAADALVRMRVK